MNNPSTSKAKRTYAFKLHLRPAASYLKAMGSLLTPEQVEDISTDGDSAALKQQILGICRVMVETKLPSFSVVKDSVRGPLAYKISVLNKRITSDMAEAIIHELSAELGIQAQQIKVASTHSSGLYLTTQEETFYPALSAVDQEFYIACREILMTSDYTSATYDTIAKKVAHRLAQLRSLDANPLRLECEAYEYLSTQLRKHPDYRADSNSFVSIGSIDATRRLESILFALKLAQTQPNALFAEDEL